MSTRLRFPRSTPADVTPVANGSYGKTSQSTDCYLATAPVGTVGGATSSLTWTAGQTARAFRYVSPPLDVAQTITGTAKMQLAALESAASSNSHARLEIYVVSADGSTVRGTLWATADGGSGSEFNTANRNIKWATNAVCSLTSVAAHAGDRLVVVIGLADASGTTPNATLRTGDVIGATDLPEDETTTTTADMPWIEFSQTLTFAKRILPVKLGSGGNNAVTSPYKTGIVSPTANVPVIVTTFFDTGDTGLPDAPTASGCNLVWTTLATAHVDDTVLVLYMGIGGSPTSGQISFTKAGTGVAPVNYGWAIFNAPGLDTTNPLVQSTSILDFSNTVTTGTMTLGATAESMANVMWSCWATTTGTETPKLGWGELDVTLANQRFTNHWLPNGSQNSSTFTLNGTSWFFGLLFELRVASQTISPTGIATAEAFGTAKIIETIHPSGIASAEAFGSPTVSVTSSGTTISPTGIASAEAFGNPAITETIHPSGIATSEVFGVPSSSGKISPTGIVTAESFGTPSVTETIHPTGIATAEAFGTPSVSKVIYPSAITTAEAFGVPVVSQVVQATGIPTAEVFGTPSLVKVLSPEGIASAEAFGLPTESQIVKAVGIPSEEAFGSPNVFVPGHMGPVGIPSEEAFGHPTIITDVSVASSKGGGANSLRRPATFNARAVLTPTLSLTVTSAIVVRPQPRAILTQWRE